MPIPCQACGAPVSFVVNLDTNKRVPLVDFDPAYPKAHRYVMTEHGGKPFCKRDDSGPLMSHFANCTNPRAFSGKK